MQEGNIRSVKFTPAVDQRFEKIAAKFGRNKRTVFVQMVDYFFHTRKDPADLNDEALKTAILKGNQNLTGFIKTQEQSLLIPIRQDTDRMISSQRTILEWLNKEEAAHHNSSANTLKLHSQKLDDIDLLVRQVAKHLQTKEQLKSQFLLIFESYIKARDQFGLMTPAREKEDLINKVKQQLKDL